MAALKSLLACSILVLAAVLIPTTTYAKPKPHPHPGRPHPHPGGPHGPSRSKLSFYFYRKDCPQALPTIRRIVKKAIDNETRMGASLLRLHFHDCFVNGCDGSVLLDDDAPVFMGEKTALANLNSIRGLEVIDEIKSELNRICKGGNVVSCADILAVAARDSVEILGGPRFRYPVFLGRRDARTASLEAANRDLPSPFANFSELLTNFQNQGLDLKDLVVLSGGHTIGLARCPTFRNRIYNATNIDQGFAAGLRKICPPAGGATNLAPLDSTTTRFDTAYYSDLTKFKGLLHSDQELFKGNGSASDALVRKYSNNPWAFAFDFGVSMIKMGNIKPLTGDEGEIRSNCRRVN